jgi:hypothetical protein
MKVLVRLLPALLLVSASARAVEVPVPIEGVKLVLNVQMQPWFQVLEDFPAPNVGEQVYLRRIRLIASGQFTDQLLFLIDIDSPNFGRNGDFNGINQRELIQDAWIAWHPVENLFVDFGLLLLPLARYTLQSTTSYTSMDFHVLSINAREPNTDGIRDMGVSLRGWLFDKRVGFRFGAYNGNRSTSFGGPSAANAPGTNNPAIDRQGAPRIAGMVNVNILDSEEGAWLYQGLYFGDKKVLSFNIGGEYQAGGVAAPYGPTDHKAGALGVFFDYPMSADSEIIVNATGYRFWNGNGAANTGWAGYADLGYRYARWQPYVSTEFFFGDSCTTDASGANLLPCAANTNELRIFSFGLNYWIKRNQIHLNSEFASTRQGSLTLATQKHQNTFTLGATMFY